MLSFCADVSRSVLDSCYEVCGRTMVGGGMVIVWLIGLYKDIA